MPTKRLRDYGGLHIRLERIALTEEDTGGLTTAPFDAEDKKDDTRYQWFVENTMATTVGNSTPWTRTIFASSSMKRLPP